MSTTEELLRKAAMVTSDIASAGQLNPTQANKFIDMLIDPTVLSKEARLERMSANKEEFNKIGFNSRIMQAATEATDPGNTDKPSTAKVELSTVEGIAVVGISYSTFEDNIERGALADHIVRLMAERAGLDLEEQWVNGDTASGDSFLAQNDGILKQVTSHTSTVADMTTPTDLVEACDKALRSLPKKYLRNKREWRYYVHADAELQLRQALSERSTGAGDRYLLDDAPVLVRGIPVVSLPVLPEIADIDGGGAGTAAGSKVLLVHPKNVVIGVQRAISIESDRLIRQRVVEYVATVRSDVTFEEEDAVAMAEVEHAA